MNLNGPKRIVRPDPVRSSTVQHQLSREFNQKICADKTKTRSCDFNTARHHKMCITNPRAMFEYFRSDSHGPNNVRRYEINVFYCTRYRIVVFASRRTRSAPKTLRFPIFVFDLRFRWTGSISVDHSWRVITIAGRPYRCPRYATNSNPRCRIRSF